jgi:ABC-2 type transport system ATP-binding protein
MPQQHILELKGLTKKFGGLFAVRDLDLKMPPGEIYGLIGPNGSGKTTTIKMIAGLYRPTRGSVSVAGHDALKTPYRAKAEIGYVPDEPAGYDLLTGREFLEFVGEAFRVDRKLRDERISCLLARFKLEETANGAFGRSSRGTRQKLSIIAALIHEPKLLLIDEPMVGLDPWSAKVAEELFREFADAGGSVLLSTHVLPTAERLCGRVGLLKGGKIIEEGSVDKISAKAGMPGGSLEDCYLKLAAD